MGRKHLEDMANLNVELSVNQLVSLSSTLKKLKSLMSQLILMQKPVSVTMVGSINCHPTVRF